MHSLRGYFGQKAHNGGATMAQLHGESAQKRAKHRIQTCTLKTYMRERVRGARPLAGVGSRQRRRLCTEMTAPLLIFRAAARCAGARDLPRQLLQVPQEPPGQAVECRWDAQGGVKDAFSSGNRIHSRSGVISALLGHIDTVYERRDNP